MKQFIAILALIMFSQAHAQTSQTVQVLPAGTVVAPQAAPISSKRTVIYDERTNELVEVAPQVQQVQAPAAPAASPIYILNTGTQAQVQDQGTMVVQDSPMNNSQAEQIRKQRANAESETEDGIVQALEKARMEDELKRRDKFNNALNPGPQAAAPVVVAPVQQVQAVQQVQTVVPAPVAEAEPVVEVSKKHEDKDEENLDIKSEIRAAIAESNVSKPKDEEREQYYVGGLVGIGAYPDIENMKGNGSAGFSVGMTSVDRWIVDGSFVYGNYELEDINMFSGRDYWGNYIPYLVDMTQMNIAVAAKYQILPGKLRPSIGPALSYTRRSYSFEGDEIKTSNAVDVGLATGVDVALTKSFAIGFDFKYFWNLTSSSNTSPRESIYYSRDNDPEDLNYYTANLVVKLLF